MPTLQRATQTALKVHLGCGTELFPAGWVNIDPRHIGTDDPTLAVQRGDACNTGLADGSVELLFSNAMFEHLYLPQVPAALREWARVITPTGQIVTIGIPNFPEVAKQYLTQGQGITGPTFDLYEVYRYAIGFPEGHLPDHDWATWSVTERMDEAPEGYLAQIHKALYDPPTLLRLCCMAGLYATIWQYAYRNEPHPLNLAFIATKEPQPHDLATIPLIGEYANLATLQQVDAHGTSRIAETAAWFDKG